jgi:hypothetical protein
MRVVTLSIAILCLPSAALARTYEVGPGRTYPDLQSVAAMLKPGDRVEIDGGVTYRGSVVLPNPGRPDAKIVIVGKRKGDARPVIAGGETTVEVSGDHYVLEGLEITGGSRRCLFHHADDLTVRDTIVHHCPEHGVLGADDGSGSLTLSYVEVHHAGHGDGAHPIYVATDEEAHPRSVFRMEHCFVHDATGGNSVKSRAERNAIYASWIDGGPYHALELVGPDGAERKHAREDSDVVGNVIRKAGPGYAIRVGGDGTGATDGRYRFVNNTIVLGRESRAAFRLFDGIECIEMHNNAILREGGGPLKVVADGEARWAAGRAVIAGSHNWIPMGSTGVPATWTRTIAGRDPGFVSDRDLTPRAGSPLVGAGALSPQGTPSFEIPGPLLSPREMPPPHTLERVGTARQRLRGGVDIGAFSYAGDVPPAPPPAPAPRCGCRAGACSGLASARLAVAIVAMAALRRRGRRRARAPGGGVRR